MFSSKSYQYYFQPEIVSSWWFQPLWKAISVRFEDVPKDRGENPRNDLKAPASCFHDRIKTPIPTDPVHLHLSTSKTLVKVTSKSFTSSPPNSPWVNFWNFRGEITHSAQPWRTNHMILVFLEFFIWRLYRYTLPETTSNSEFTPKRMGWLEDDRFVSLLGFDLFSGGKLAINFRGSCKCISLLQKNPWLHELGAIISNDHITRYGNDQHFTDLFVLGLGIS